MLRAPHARRRYRRQLEAFAPDAMLAFNPAGVVTPVLDDFANYSKKTGAVFGAYVSDSWVCRWPIDNPLSRVLLGCRGSRRMPVCLAGKLIADGLSAVGWVTDEVLRFDEMMYCSSYIAQISRAKATTLATHTVIPWGLRDREFLEPVPAWRFAKRQPLTLLYAGQIEEHKGPDIAIKALARCRARHRLVLFGDADTSFAGACRQLAHRLGVADRVEFAGRRDPRQMMTLMRDRGEVLIVPSMWEEPFSIVALQGMSLGMPVIASRTGGTAEGIADGQTGLLFERGDSSELAAMIDRLETDWALCRELGAAARARVLADYRLSTMVDRILERLSQPSGHDAFASDEPATATPPGADVLTSNETMPAFLSPFTGA